MTEKNQNDQEGKIEESNQQLEECQKQRDEYLAGWQRAKADFINYKKDEIERVSKILQYATEELALRFLPMVDNFEITEKVLPEDLKKDKHIEGLLLIKNQIKDFLKNQGIEEFNSVGEKFDPNFHEVVEEVEDKEKESGTVLEEIQKGYKINGKLLRPAKVKISKT